MGVHPCKPVIWTATDFDQTVGDFDHVTDEHLDSTKKPRIKLKAVVLNRETWGFEDIGMNIISAIISLRCLIPATGYGLIQVVKRLFKASRSETPRATPRKGRDWVPEAQITGGWVNPSILKWKVWNWNIAMYYLSNHMLYDIMYQIIYVHLYKINNKFIYIYLLRHNK